ncbi:MAG: hypothetical protein ACI81A_001213, partial [Paraglaciecola sp.]
FSQQTLAERRQYQVCGQHSGLRHDGLADLLTRKNNPKFPNIAITGKPHYD